MQHQKLFIPIEGVTEFISMINPLILEEESILKHLYVKQHSITKLLYFGMTTQDPIKYKGSGDYWNLHLKKYGGCKEFIKTLYVWTFNNQSDATSFALKFSEDNNIVESKLWANLILEDALTGNGRPKGYKHTDETKKKLHNSHLGVTLSEYHCQCIIEAHQNMSQETKEIRSQKMSIISKGKRKSNEHCNSMSIGRQNMSLDAKELESQNKSIAQIERHLNMTFEEKESMRQKISATLTGKHLSESHKQACSAGRKGKHYYDKVGEKSKMFYEQPDDLTWIPRKKF